MESNENNNQEEQKEPTTIELIEKVKATDEFKTLVKNEAKNYIGSELKTMYNTFDSVVKEALGVDKPEDIKSTDWIKQHLSKTKELEKELQVLKSKGNPSEEQEKLWKDKERKLKLQLEEANNKITSIAQKGFEQNVSNQIDTFLVGKTFKATYSEDDVQTLVNAKKVDIIKNTRKLDNGKIAVFNPSKDEYYTDTLGEPLTPAQVAEMKFSSMFQTNKKGGNAPSDTPNAATKGDIVAIDMTKIKSREDFFKEFKTQIAPKGLASHQEEYLKIQRATMEHYKINSLPLA